MKKQNTSVAIDRLISLGAQARAELQVPITYAQIILTDGHAEDKYKIWLQGPWMSQPVLNFVSLQKLAPKTKDARVGKVRVDLSPGQMEEFALDLVRLRSEGDCTEGEKDAINGMLSKISEKAKTHKANPEFTFRLIAW